MTRNQLVHGLLVLCVLQTAQIGRQSVRTFRQWSEVYRLSNAERRLLFWGPFYRETLKMQSVIPRTAMVRWVSTDYAWYGAYYLYPRLLKPAASADPKTTWTLTYTNDKTGVRMDAKAPGASR